MIEEQSNTNGDSVIVATTEVPADLSFPTVPEAVPVVTNRQLLIRGLRDLATLLEAHPTIPTPVCTTMNAFVQTREQLAAVARIGAWQKKSNEDYFWLSRTFAGDPDFPTLTMDVNIARTAVCRRVVTGTKTIPAQPEREVEIVEWICDEPLLAGGVK